MAIPSGSGTEILGKFSGSLATTSNTTIFTVPANHIYTIISFSICRDGGTLTKITVRINDGTSDRVILFEEGLSEQTFIWNDRIVLMPGNVFKFQPNGTSSMQYWISYIDQDWS
tara:strand:- start:210 stop:551 length:342 start_codon:yes stop_codon:yes gene_type:complete